MDQANCFFHEFVIIESQERSFLARWRLVSSSITMGLTIRFPLLRDGYLTLDATTYDALQIFQTEKHPSSMGIGNSKEGYSFVAIPHSFCLPLAYSITASYHLQASTVDPLTSTLIFVDLSCSFSVFGIMNKVCTISTSFALRCQCCYHVFFRLHLCRDTR